LKEWVNLLSEKEDEGRKETFLQDENNLKASEFFLKCDFSQ